MVSKLSCRLDALEAIVLPSNVDEAAEAERQEQASQKITAFIAELERRKAEYEALDASGRIKHWLKKIEEAENYIAHYSDKPPPSERKASVHPVIDLRESFWRCELKMFKDNLAGTYQFELTAARLDALEELGFNSERLKQWNDIRKKYESMPYQWRGEYLVLSSDALAALNPDAPR